MYYFALIFAPRFKIQCKIICIVPKFARKSSNGHPFLNVNMNLPTLDVRFPSDVSILIIFISSLIIFSGCMGGKKVVTWSMRAHWKVHLKGLEATVSIVKFGATNVDL